MKVEVGETADCYDAAANAVDEDDTAERFTELDAEVVRRAVSCLPPVLREAVMLRYFEDRTLQEMAELMKVPVGTVKSRLKRAQKRLNDMLSEVLGRREGDNEK